MGIPALSRTNRGHAMNSRLWIIAIVVTAVLAGVAGFVLASQSRTQAIGQRISSKGARKILYWRDPMVPSARFDKPGKSPFMDMELVPVYEGDESDRGVQIDPRVAQSLGIRTGRVE